MTFENTRALCAAGCSRLRAHAVDILSAGLAAVLTRPALADALQLDGSDLVVARHGRVPLPAGDGRLFVVAMGKAAFSMSAAFEQIVEYRVHDGVAVGIDAAECQRDLSTIRYRQGSHPLPSETTLANTDAILRMLDDAQLTERDLVVVLVSGGASALVERPRCTFEQLRAVNVALLRCGTDIHETNAVRKHLSTTKGGQLALRCFPARVLSLIVSDVLDNDVSVIASGPTALDRTTLATCAEIIERFGIHKRVGGDDCASVAQFMRDLNFAETPKDDAAFARHVTNVVLLSNAVAVDAMSARARALGFDVEDRGVTLRGEARDVGRRFAAELRPGVAVVGAGETTVTVRGHGAGGRNQELALGAVGHFAAPGVVCALGTDGLDNGPFAGAIVDHLTPTVGAEDALAQNDSTGFFAALAQAGGAECRIVTGPTGTNVSDLFLALGDR